VRKLGSMKNIELVSDTGNILIMLTKQHSD